MSERRFWNPEIETMPREALEDIQAGLLRSLVERAYEKSPFYASLFRQAGVAPSDIRELSDVRKLPFTDKRSVAGTYPFGLLLAETADLREVHAGTTHHRQILPVWATQKDLDDWGERCARHLWMTGLRPGDSIQNAFRFGLSTGGFGFHYGARKMGMLSIPASTGGTDHQIDALVDLGVTAITMMPSYAMFLGMRAAERGIDLARDGALKVGLFGAEPYSAETKAKLTEVLGLEAFNEYGMNEFLGPGMACECPLHQGLHAWVDHILLECVDPETGEPVKEGAPGDLVWTNLAAEAMGFIRYRSHDLSRVHWEKCACGRTHPRIQPIGGRSDEILSIGGYVVYPQRFEEVLGTFPQLGAFHVLLDSVKGLDALTLRVEMNEEEVPQTAAVKRLRERVAEAVKSYVGVTPRVDLVSCGALHLDRPGDRPGGRPGGRAGEGARFRVLDYRKGSGKYGL